MSKSPNKSLVVVDKKAEQDATARLIETATGLRPDNITVPLSLMKPWYLMDKKELITKLQKDWGEKCVLIENKVGYLLWIKCCDTPAPFLMVHHIDTVQPHSSATFVAYRHSGQTFIHSPHNDDRLGVATAMATLPANGVTNYDILITDMEEVGNTTARDFMDWVEAKENGPTPDELERIGGYRAILEFDRGGDDWVTYESHNKEGYEYLVNGLGWKHGRGSFSDVKALQGLGVFTINFGTGYQNAHALTGYASIEVYAWCVANAISFMRHFGAEGKGKLLHEQRKSVTTHYQQKKPAGTSVNRPPASSPWQQNLPSTRPMINATMDKLQSASRNYLLADPSGDYVEVPEVAVRLLSPLKVGRPVENANCGLCGSKVGTMGEMQYTYNAAITPSNSDAAVQATLPIILCDPCMRAHQDRRVTCANHHGKLSVFMAPPTPLGAVIPGNSCLLFCECTSPLVGGVEDHKLTHIRVTERGKSDPVLVPRTYSDLIRFASQHPGFDMGSYICDNSEVSYPVAAFPGSRKDHWWSRLLWGEGPYLCMVSSVAMKKVYGDAFYSDWYAIVSNAGITLQEYLMEIGEIQRYYEGLGDEEEE